MKSTGVFWLDITDLVQDLREKHELWKDLVGEQRSGNHGSPWQVLAGDDLIFLQRCSAALMNGDPVVIWLMARIFQADADPTRDVSHSLVDRLLQRVMGPDADWRPSIGREES